MPTITRYAHSNLESFLKAVVTNAAAGDFLDASKWPRSYIGQRPYSSFPNVGVTTSKTKPTGSGHAATTGDKLYTETFPQPFGVFLNDVQLAVATGGAQAGKEIESITLPSRLRPYSRMNVTFKAAPVTPVSFKTNLPATKSAAIGDDVTFTVEAQDGKTPYTYVWEYKAAAGSYVVIDATVNPTAATASLVNHVVDATSAGSYRCKVTDSSSTPATITSTVCVLSVA